MHELSLCQALLRQVDEIARRESAKRVTRIILQVGPLSGVVPELLQRAFTIARTGSVAERAELVIEEQPVRVRCTLCGAESAVSQNRLLCRECGDYRTQLIGGDELLLKSLELKRMRSR